ncbi:hypothetical protein BAUCODRAFT_63319, partial [Baudoinia panamericana UAMH 10762]
LTMSLTVEKLNDDTTFLLAFAPAFAPKKGNIVRKFPGAYTILLDPWLSGQSSILHPTFQVSRHTSKVAVKSLADLRELPDVIIISQDKPDHCHRKTLCSLPKNTRTQILATPAAAKKIESWRHFEPGVVRIIRPYCPEKPDALFKIPLAPYTHTSSAGEITIANVPTRRDITGLHNAIGITYRPPGSLLTSHDGDCKTISAIYTPHGLSFSALAPYLQSHLDQLSALPVTALFHCVNSERNPWFMGGLVARGAPGGTDVAVRTRARYWISAHDEAKENRGVSVRWIKGTRYSPEEVVSMLVDKAAKAATAEQRVPEVKFLAVGETMRIEG